jgi:hypothetical protein
MPSKDQHILGQHREHRETDVRREESGATIQLRQEELAARTQAVDAGRVSVGTEVVQEQQTLEVPITREEVSIERQQIQQDYFGLTDSIPQEGWYWAAMASVAVSAALWLVGKRDWSTFVGQWPPTFLLLGVFHKQLRPSQ